MNVLSRFFFLAQTSVIGSLSHAGDDQVPITAYRPDPPSRHKLSLSDSRLNRPSGTAAHVSRPAMLFVMAARNQAQVLPSG